MSTLRKAAMFAISTSMTLLMIATNTIMETADKIMFRMLISEKMCISCSKSSPKITKEYPVCDECSLTMMNEGNDPEELDHQHPYPPKPIEKEGLIAYR